jgi:hypothetical protein
MKPKILWFAGMLREWLYLNRILSVVPQEGAGLMIGFGFEYEIIFRIQAAGLQIK